MRQYPLEVQLELLKIDWWIRDGCRS